MELKKQLMLLLAEYACYVGARASEDLESPHSPELIDVLKSLRDLHWALGHSLALRY